MHVCKTRETISPTVYFRIPQAMEGIRQSSLPLQSSSLEKRGFKWSCRPLSLMMQFCCLPLGFNSIENRKGIPSTYRPTRLTSVIVVFVFFYNVTCNFFFFAEKYLKSDPYHRNKKKGESSTFAFNNLIEMANNVVAVVGIHGIILTIAFGNQWRQLLRLLKVIQQQENPRFYSDSDYKRFRNICIVGVSIFLLVMQHEM